MFVKHQLRNYQLIHNNCVADSKEDYQLNYVLYYRSLDSSTFLSGVAICGSFLKKHHGIVLALLEKVQRVYLRSLHDKTFPLLQKFNLFSQHCKVCFVLLKYCWSCELQSSLLNPLLLYISICILQTFLVIFPLALTRRICFTIKAFQVGDHFLYSHDLNE